MLATLVPSAPMMATTKDVGIFVFPNSALLSVFLLFRGKLICGLD